MWNGGHFVQGEMSLKKKQWNWTQENVIDYVLFKMPFCLGLNILNAENEANFFHSPWIDTAIDCSSGLT